MFETGDTVGAPNKFQRGLIFSMELRRKPKKVKFNYAKSMAMKCISDERKVLVLIMRWLGKRVFAVEELSIT